MDSVPAGGAPSPSYVKVSTQFDVPTERAEPAAKYSVAYEGAGGIAD